MQSISQKLLVALCLATTLKLHGQGAIVFDQQSAANPLTINYDTFDLYIQTLYESFVPTQASIGVVQLELSDDPDTDTNGAKIAIGVYSGSPSAPILLASTRIVYLPPNFNNDNIGFSGITNFYFATPVALTPGQPYYIVPMEVTGSHGWSVAVTDNTYPNGGLYGFSGTDLWFREGIVTVPEPSDLISLIIGGLLMAGIFGTALESNATTKATI